MNNENPDIGREGEDTLREGGVRKRCAKILAAYCLQTVSFFS